MKVNVYGVNSRRVLEQRVNTALSVERKKKPSQPPAEPGYLFLGVGKLGVNKLK